MHTSLARLEKQVFRKLNAVVEPAVRRGFGSISLAPASLIVLETVGFKSGKERRTPLWSIRLGRYRVVSTARGDRSFWVKNLQQQPRASYYVGGKRRDSDVIVIDNEYTAAQAAVLTPLMNRLTGIFSRYAQRGWAFAILAPVTPKV